MGCQGVPSETSIIIVSSSHTWLGSLVAFGAPSLLGG